MAPRSRFDEFLRAELGDLRGRCVAEHATEVGRLENMVALLEDENETLRKQLTQSKPRSQQRVTVASAQNEREPAKQRFAPAKNPRTFERSRSEMAPAATPEEASASHACRTWAAASPQLVHVTPPSGPAATIDLEGQETELEACFNSILPSGFVPPKSARQDSRSSHHQTIEAALDDVEDVSHEGPRRSGSKSLSVGGPPSPRGASRLERGHVALRNDGSSPQQGSSGAGTPPLITMSIPSEVIVAARQSIRNEQDLAPELGDIKKENRRHSYESMNSMGSIEGDVDFEVLPEWRNIRAVCTKRRTIINLAAVNVAESSIDIQPLQHRLSPFMIMPSSSVNAFWLCAGLVCLVWDLIAIPFGFLGIEEGGFMLTMSWTARLFWTLDMCKSFLTGRLQPDGFVEMRLDQVAKQYACTWLPLDFLCVACDWSIPLAGAGMRWLRVVSLARLAKVTQVESLISQYTCSETMVLLVGLMKLVVALLVSAHFIACVWCRIGMGTWGDEQPLEGGWVAHHDLLDAPLQDRYVWSLHWSLAQFMGEMIFEPRNRTERGFAIFVLVVAFFYSAFFVSGITTSMTRLMIVAGSQSSQLQALHRYLFSLRVSSSLTARLQRNAQHILTEQGRNTPTILSQISEPLRVELYYELHSPAILAHPFFKGYDQLHPASVRRVCHVAVTTVLLSRGDIVFSDYEAPACPRMYFVHGSGGLRYKQIHHPVQFVEHGDWICEPVLWTHWVHCGSLTASHECEILALGAGAFRSVANLFPTKHACKYASAFIQQLNQVDRASLSDLWQPDFEEILDGGLPRKEKESLEHHHVRLSPSTSQGTSSVTGISGTLRSFIKARQKPKGAWS